MYVGEGLVSRKLADAAKPLGAAVYDKKVNDHTARDGQNVLFLRFEPTGGKHPQRERDRKNVIEPEIEKIGRIPSVVCVARGDAEHDGRGGEHGEHDRILPRQLKFGHKHQQNEDHVEIADLKHLNKQRLPAQGQREERHIKRIAPEDAARTKERTDDEQNGLRATGELVRGVHGQRDKRHRRQQKHQMCRFKGLHGLLRDGDGVGGFGKRTVFHVLHGQYVFTGRLNRREPVNIPIRQRNSKY